MSDGSEFDDELEIDVRPAEALVGRMIALASICRRIALESAVPELQVEDDDDDDLEDEDDVVSEQFDMLLWLEDEKLTDAVAASEWMLLRAAIGTLGDGALAIGTLAAEALTAVAWVAGVAPRQPDPAQPTDPGALLAQIPAPWDSGRAFVATLTPHSDDDAGAERERAELWLWRLLLEEERRAARAGTERKALDAVVHATAGEAAAAGYWRTRGGDALLGEQRVSDSPAELIALATDLARARLQALNWACGYGKDWDSVPLDLD